MSCVWMAMLLDMLYSIATGGRVTGIWVKTVPSRPMSLFDSTTPSAAGLLAGSNGSMSGGVIIPWTLVMNDRYCSRRKRSDGVLPYHVGRYQQGLRKSRARAISSVHDGLK